MGKLVPVLRIAEWFNWWAHLLRAHLPIFAKEGYGIGNKTLKSGNLANSHKLFVSDPGNERQTNKHLEKHASASL